MFNFLRIKEDMAVGEIQPEGHQFLTVERVKAQ